MTMLVEFRFILPCAGLGLAILFFSIQFSRIRDRRNRSKVFRDVQILKIEIFLHFDD